MTTYRLAAYRLAASKGQRCQSERSTTGLSMKDSWKNEDGGHDRVVCADGPDKQKLEININNL